MDDKLYCLAELIKLMATSVSKEDAHWLNESISAALGLFESDLYFDEIKVTDDGKRRSITLGDMRGDISRVNGRTITKEEHLGYLVLYTEEVNENKSFYYRCFPSVKEIYEKLKMVLNKVVLDDGFSWYERKDDTALDYYSKVVKEHAEVLERIGITPQEIFNSCH